MQHLFVWNFVHVQLIVKTIGQIQPKERLSTIQLDKRHLRVFLSRDVSSF